MDLFDALAVRLNPDRARGVSLQIGFVVGGDAATVSIERQTEFVRPGTAAGEAVLTLSRGQLEQVTSPGGDLDRILEDGAVLTGSRDAILTWLSLHDHFDLWFNLVTP